MVILNDNILIIIIVSCSSIAFLLFLLLLVVKNHFIDEKRNRDRNLVSLHKNLVDYLLGAETLSTKAKEALCARSKSKRQKNLLIRQLIVLNHNFSGIYSDKVFALYKDLSLFDHSYSKLRRSSWHHKIQGMYELSTLEYVEAYDEIAALLNHKNADVKRNARVSVVKLRKIEALMELKDVEGNFSRWTQINILAILKRNPTKLTKAQFSQLQADKNPYMRELANALAQANYV